jgi:chromosome segregation ATPase
MRMYKPSTVVKTSATRANHSSEPKRPVNPHKGLRVTPESTHQQINPPEEIIKAIKFYYNKEDTLMTEHQKVQVTLKNSIEAYNLKINGQKNALKIKIKEQKTEIARLVDEITSAKSSIANSRNDLQNKLALKNIEYQELEKRLENDRTDLEETKNKNHTSKVEIEKLRVQNKNGDESASKFSSEMYQNVKDFSTNSNKLNNEMKNDTKKETIVILVK